jgi:crotonobetainyl-CoA:carnitine CoA-transferase CaiB-like acyl-CoA transferase
VTDAFEGIKVIDLCRGFPTAFSAMFLADFGAEVIKIYPPDHDSGYSSRVTPDRWSACYSIDRGKKGMVINLKNERGKDIFLKLAKDADIIVENSRPGAMEHLGIGYKTIRRVNPRIIYCSVSGYGTSGPYKDLPGHASSYEGVAGILSLFGQKDGPPINTGPFIADMGGAACHALIGILIALWVREKTGKGQFIDVAYLDSALSLAHWQVSLYQALGIMPKRGEVPEMGSDPCSAMYRTKDGEYFCLAADEPKFWANLLRELGGEEYIPFQRTENRQKKEEIFGWLREKFLTKTRDEWWEWFKDKDIGGGPVYSLEEGLRDPQVLHREMVLELEHPRVGKVKQVGIGIKLSESPGRFRSFAPLPSEHTAEILQGFGYTKEQIEELKSSGVIA